MAVSDQGHPSPPGEQVPPITVKVQPPPPILLSESEQQSPLKVHAAMALAHEVPEAKVLAPPEVIWAVLLRAAKAIRRVNKINLVVIMFGWNDMKVDDDIFLFVFVEAIKEICRPTTAWLR